MTVIQGEEILSWEQYARRPGLELWLSNLENELCINGRFLRHRQPKCHFLH